jgi:two-component system response regulator GlrR
MVANLSENEASGVDRECSAKGKPRPQGYSEEFLRRVGKSEVPILLHGETGAGKEVMARRLWGYSPRAGKPFLKLNCAALPSELIESELFGYEKGAFTGASMDKPGKFELAQNGTILLDEIGDMDIRLQAKLLQVLQDGEVRPLGSSRVINVNVRIMAATHRDLRQAIEGGSFREDLYYRLNVVGLQLPTLEQRREDIPALIAARLAQLAAAGAPRRVYSAEAMELLVSAPWPGNIRQLFNVIEQSVALSPGRTIGAAQLRRCLGEQPSVLPSLDEARSSFTRNYLRQLLELSGGNISRAARLAGRNRTDFYKLMSRHGIDPAAFKSGAPRPAAPAVPAEVPPEAQQAPPPLLAAPEIAPAALPLA